MNPEKTPEADSPKFKDPWWIFGELQSENFQNDPGSFTELLVTAGAFRKCMVKVYETMVKYGVVTKIDYIEAADKLRIWNFAKKLANGRLDNNQCIELSKVLYILE